MNTDHSQKRTLSVPLHLFVRCVLRLVVLFAVASVTENRTCIAKCWFQSRPRHIEIGLQLAEKSGEQQCARCLVFSAPFGCGTLSDQMNLPVPDTGFPGALRKMERGTIAPCIHLHGISMKAFHGTTGQHSLIVYLCLVDVSEQAASFLSEQRTSIINPVTNRDKAFISVFIPVMVELYQGVNFAASDLRTTP